MGDNLKACSASPGRDSYPMNIGLRMWASSSCKGSPALGLERKGELFLSILIEREHQQEMMVF